MSVHADHNGRVRIQNLRPTTQAKEILDLIKQYRASEGHTFTQNQLFVEAVFGYFKTEAVKARKKLSKEQKPAHVAA